jgi:hypothetical protein
MASPVLIQNLPQIIGAVCAGIVLVGGFVVQTVMMVRQNRRIDTNHRENVGATKELAEKIDTVVTATTGVRPAPKFGEER